ncbi:MAG: aminotransferase class V-fold PLP-dependent enzyme [Bacillota bacterium]
MINKPEYLTDSNLNLYFDNAATSWPKPESVYKAAEIQMRQACGNPGRSGHTRTLEADRLIFHTREALAALFNAEDSSRIIFTLNATDALNIALKGFLKSGDHVIYTAMEHNSVLRPLGRLRRDGLITTTVIPCSEEGHPDLEFLENAYKPNTRLLVVNHASNVTGTIMPLNKMIHSAHNREVAVLVDAAQTAGTIEIDLDASKADMMAFTGHKGLLGPTGTGGLYVRTGIDLLPLREGGTGSQSEIDLHPESMPERLEAGTLNAAGLAGLLEGVQFIQKAGLAKIRTHEKDIRSALFKHLKSTPGIHLYGPEDAEQCSCIVSFTIKNVDSGEAGYILENSYGILCRTGLHCAPLAHKAIGTFPEGTVRISPGFFTDLKDIEYLISALKDIVLLSAK